MLIEDDMTKTTGAREIGITHLIDIKVIATKTSAPEPLQPPTRRSIASRLRSIKSIRHRHISHQLVKTRLHQNRKPNGSNPIGLVHDSSRQKIRQSLGQWFCQRTAVDESRAGSVAELQQGSLVEVRLARPVVESDQVSEMVVGEQRWRYFPLPSQPCWASHGSGNYMQPARRGGGCDSPPKRALLSGCSAGFGGLLAEGAIGGPGGGGCAVELGFLGVRVGGLCCCWKGGGWRDGAWRDGAWLYHAHMYVCRYVGS